MAQNALELDAAQLSPPAQPSPNSGQGTQVPLTLHVRLLGVFSLVYGDKPVTGVNTSRLQSLLAYLTVHRDAPVSRQQLAFTLWPDSTESQARTNLRKLLHDLRRVLPQAKGCLYIEGSYIEWYPNIPVTLDVAEFQGAIDSAATDGATAQAQLERAVALYRGDLLPECYDEWVLPLRDQLSHAFATALGQLVRIYEGRRDYRPAIVHAQRLLQCDPLNEDVYRTLMRLHALDDDRTAVARVYQSCCEVLLRELGVEPDDETRQLHEQIMHTRAYVQLTNAVDQPGMLVGRAQEWQRLLRVWAAATQGGAQCILIAGEAGIGKTRLAEAFIAWAARQGIATAAARCYAAEGALPFAPIVAWLRSEAVRRRLAMLGEMWLGEVARLLPELLVDHPKLPRAGPLTEAWQRQRLFEALAHAVLTVQPVVLFVDDLQWADRETVEWLHFLLRFDPRARLLLLGTARSEELTADHPLRVFQVALQREGRERVTEIELDPLNSAETAALATHVAGQSLPPDQVAHLYRETEGLPLFVVESMRIGNRESGAAWYLSPTVQAVIARRLSTLSAGARDLVGLAATIGREFTLDVLARASESDEDTLVRGIDELLQRRIIREHTNAPGENVYDFSHDKMREVALAGLSGARRCMLHRRVAEALEAAYLGHFDIYSGQIAAHYEQAGMQERASDYYQRAAEVARRMYANADAIRYYQHAQRLLDLRAEQGLPRASALPAIGESLGDVLHHVTRDDDARSAYQHALANTEQTDVIGRARLQRKIGNTWRDKRCYQEALQAYQSAEDELGEPSATDSTPTWWQEWIQAQFEKDSVFYWLGQVDASGELLTRLQPIVKVHGTLGQQAAFFGNLASRTLRHNRNVATGEAVSYARTALDAFIQAGDQARIPAATFGFGFMLLWHAEPEQAEKLMLDALGMAERTGDSSLVARCVTYLTIAYRQIGQVERVQYFIARSLEAAEIAHMPEYTALAEANAAWLAWRTGDWPNVHMHGQVAIELWRKLPPGHASLPFQWTALCPLMAAVLHKDDIAQAIGHAKTLLDPGLQRLPDAFAVMLERAVQAWEGGQRQAARDFLEQSLPLARQYRLL